MALARTLKRWAGSDVSPLRVTGTALPGNLLLMARLIILCLLLFSEWRHFKVPFLPLVPAFDALRSFEAFPLILHAAFFFGVLCVLFNRSVRTGCLLVGLAVLLAILAGRIEYRNHSVLASFLLILIGLHTGKHTLALLRLQIAVVYFGAGLNKVLDPDWLDGRFFEYWTHERLNHAPYMLAASYFPPMLLSRLMSWTTIFLEFSIALGFLIPRFYVVSVWLGIALHTSIMLFTIETANLQGLFAYFFPVAVASYLAFFKWPKGAINISYDPGHAVSRTLQSISRLIDWDRRFCWRPFPHNPNAKGNRPYLLLTVRGRTWADLKALRLFLLWNPATYLAWYCGFLFLFRALPFAAGLVFDSRYIPFGAVVKALYVLVPAVFFFPLFTAWIDSGLKRLGSRPSPEVHPAQRSAMRPETPHPSQR